MPELLLFKWDHSAQSVPLRNLVALPKRFDLIDHHHSGWNWGTQELTNPWFRIVVWNAAIPAQADALLSPRLPLLDSFSVAKTLWQYRGFFFNALDVRIPAVLRNWWQDDTRAVPKFVVPGAFVLQVSDFQVARVDVADPDYTGAG